MKKIILTMILSLFAVHSLDALLPSLPSTTNLTTLKKMLKKTKSIIAPKLQELKALVVKYNKQVEFAEEFEHIKLYYTFQEENNILEDDLIKKYQISVGMLDWYLLQVSLWLQGLEHEGEKFHITYLK
jgi:hypothetical protein